MTETFSTAADNQVEIEIRPFRGVAKLARDTKPLGRFVVTGLPRAPRGTLNVAVTFAGGRRRDNNACGQGRSRDGPFNFADAMAQSWALAGGRPQRAAAERVIVSSVVSEPAQMPDPHLQKPWGLVPRCGSAIVSAM